MPKTLIGTYATKDDAARVRRELERAGVSPDAIRMHAGEARSSTEPLPEDRGLAGFIGRMFSGMTGDVTNIRKYEAHARDGGALLAVDVSDEAPLDVLQPLMRVGGDVDVHGSGTAAPIDSDVADADEVVATANGPERNPLPNASSGWNTSRAGSPSTIGTIGHDPARPEGLTADAQGLGVGNPRTSADQRTTASSPDGAANDGAPDALGHRSAGNTPGADRATPRKP